VLALWVGVIKRPRPGEEKGTEMSASLLIAIPLALLAIVLLFCFIGCDLVLGLQHLDPFRRYTEVILAEPTLVAYWPLGEAAGETTAVDLKPPGPGPTEHI
jgi:hypothetical protein